MVWFASFLAGISALLSESWDSEELELVLLNVSGTTLFSISNSFLPKPSQSSVLSFLLVFLEGRELFFSPRINLAMDLLELVPELVPPNVTVGADNFLSTF